MSQRHSNNPLIANHQLDGRIGRRALAYMQTDSLAPGISRSREICHSANSFRYFYAKEILAATFFFYRGIGPQGNAKSFVATISYQLAIFFSELRHHIGRVVAYRSSFSNHFGHFHPSHWGKWPVSLTKYTFDMCDIYTMNRP
jgi:hypothetical protein